MNDIAAIAERNQQRAWEVVEATGVVAAWESIGARPHLVGSLKTGLLMDRQDIDFHIYSDTLTVADSFAAVARLAANERFVRGEYVNLLNTDEMCLEWHTWYRDADNELWQIDMIHMPSDAPYAGYFEMVADRILAVLTDETRQAILAIKHAVPPELKVMGVEVYRAVISDGVRDYAGFELWRQDHPVDGIIDWVP
jgi:hypothetical protein